MPVDVKLTSTTIATPGFTGGANIRDAVNLIQPNEARPLENITFDERGGATKRRGCAHKSDFGATTARVLSMKTFYRGALFVPQIIMHTSDGWLIYTTDPTANPVVWTVMASGLSTTAPMSYEIYSNKVYMSNGVDNYCAWSGSVFTTFPSAPKGRFLRLWKDCMWVSGAVGLDDRVYRSDKGTAESFTVSNWVDINQGDGDSIQALAYDIPSLVVGKRETTHTIYDPVLFYNRVVDPEKGFESHFAVQQFEGDLFFLSRRGICQYLGDAPSQVLSEKIDPLFTADLVALDQLTKATSYSFLNRIGFAIPEYGQTKNTVVIEYYPRLGTYSTAGVKIGGPFSFHRMPVQAFARYRWGSVDRLYAGHNNENNFLEVFAPIGTDDGATFQAVLQTAWFNFGSPLNTKYLRSLRILCAGRFQLLIYRDFDQVHVYRTLSIDATGEAEPTQDILRTDIDGYGRYFSFRFQDPYNADTNTQNFLIGSQAKSFTVGEWAIYGLVAEGTALGERSS